MDTPPEQPGRPLDSFAEKSLAVLRKEYFVIGKTRVSSFTSWAIIAFFVGVTVTVALLASRSGTLESSQAAQKQEGANSQNSVVLWKQMPSGVEASQALRVVSPSMMYTIGADKRIYRFDGSGWTVITSCCVKGSFVFVNEKDIYAINPANLVMHWDGKNWVPLGANNKFLAKQALHYVEADSVRPQKLYAIGMDNRIWRWDGSSQNWDPITDCCVKDDFAFLADSNIYAIGTTGNLVLWNSGSWHTLSTSLSIKDRIIFTQTINTDLIYAIGSDGNIWCWTGGSVWTQITRGKAAYRDFHFYSENNIYILGKEGNIWRWTGGVKPSITVVKPNGNEKWSTGTLQEISWKSTGPYEKVGLSLRRRSGLPVYASTNQTVWTLGTYDRNGTLAWMVPNLIAGNDYIMEAVNYNSSTPSSTWVKDESNAPFTIASSTVFMPQP